MELEIMNGTEPLVQLAHSLPRNRSTSTEALQPDANAALPDPSMPASPLSRYSSAGDTAHGDSYPLPLALDVSCSSPLLSFDRDADATGTQIRRRNLHPRSSAPPAQPATSLINTDDGMRAHHDCVRPEPDAGAITLLSYIMADLNFKLDQPSSSLFGETTRDKLYNSLFFVGPQLERFMFVGLAKCLDSLLAVMLVLPLQAMAALATCTNMPFRGVRVFHIIVFAVWACTCVAMTQVKVGAIYFWMKEITPYFLKIHGLYAALDVLNKVLRDYAVDSVSSIACSCTKLAAGQSSLDRSRIMLQIACDAVISWLLISLSGLTMMCQAIIYYVVLNSGQNSIVALLIATKLLEVKGIVYKRFDEHKLLDMARMDLAERFSLFVALLFVVGEELLSTGSLIPDTAMVFACTRIFACEVMVDILKHTALSKFNSIRPPTYREFFRELAKDTERSIGYAFNKVATIDQFGAAALISRQLYLLCSMKVGQMCGEQADELAHSNDPDAANLHMRNQTSLSSCFVMRVLPTYGPVMVLVWISLLASKVVLGYRLHCFVIWFNSFYDSNFKTLFRKRL